MKRAFTVALLLAGICFSSRGYGEWESFEHRYPYELSDVIEADQFTEKDGYWEAYREDTLVGYVFLSEQWTKKLIGYSGKHLETVIGMNRKGLLTGAKVIFHSEPIVLIGLKEKNYQKFMKQYGGKSIMEELSVGKGISMDAITGATITAVVQNAIILGSARKVASLTGMLKFDDQPLRKLSQGFVPLSWKELIDIEAIERISITAHDLGIGGEETYLDLYFALIPSPSIRRNILGTNLYRETMARLKTGESAIAIFSRGEGSFKGSGFARGGVFDRFHLEQQDRMYVFRDKDYRILSKVEAEGAPQMKEGGLFIVRGTDFEETRPFTFSMVLPYRAEGFRREFKSFGTEYKVPERLLD